MTNINCDANKLPEEIQDKAREYVAKRKPRFRTFGVVSDDVECAWLNGFAFCLEGKVKVALEEKDTELKVEKAFCEKACEGADKMYKDLTKAKEIIATFLGLVQTSGYSPSMYKCITEARQFMNSEVEK